MAAAIVDADNVPDDGVESALIEAASKLEATLDHGGKLDRIELLSRVMVLTQRALANLRED